MSGVLSPASAVAVLDCPCCEEPPELMGSDRLALYYFECLNDACGGRSSAKSTPEAAADEWNEMVRTFHPKPENA